jgi:hypothetical protein
VPGHRSTDLAFDSLFKAKRIRDQREKSMNPQGPGYIDSIREELSLRGKALKYQLYEIGRLLWEVKRLIPHGEFKPWVEEYFEHSYRTALNCTRVYRACMGRPELVEYFQPSCLYIIAAPNFPPDLREALLKNAKGPVDVSKAKLVEVTLKYKRDEIGIEDPEVQSLLHESIELDLQARLLIELRALRSLVKDRLRRINDLSSRQIAQPLLENRFDQGDWVDQIIGRIVDLTAYLREQISKLQSQTGKSALPTKRLTMDRIEKDMGFVNKYASKDESEKCNSCTNETVSHFEATDADIPF